jgi:hypothetical protein
MNHSKGILLALALAGATLSNAQQRVAVNIDGHPVQFNGGGAVESQGRVLVPLRGVFEQLGAYVQWNPRSQEINASKGPTNIQLHVGSRLASVNGRSVNLDVPPRVTNGRTMVPLRFVSEALGADVDWKESQRLVLINSGGSARESVVTETRRTRSALRVNTVIPVTLTQALTSDGSHEGDTFSTAVRTGNNGEYGGLPSGTRVEGHVVMAKPKQGNQPGALQLSFDRIRMIDGSSQDINGSLVSLDADSVTKGDGGLLQAKPGKATSKDPLVYVGYGAGAGAVLAILTKGNVVTDAVVGGALGYLFHELQKSQNNPKNVNLAAGTQMGVRLDAPVEIKQ